jgi:predicted PurR-regulated permease PerM
MFLSAVMERIQIGHSTITYAVFLVALVILAYYARYIVLTALIGIGIGTLIAPVLGKLRSHLKLPRSLSALIVFLGLCFIIGGVLISIYFLVADQVNTLSSNAPQYSAHIKKLITDMFDRYPWIKSQVQEIEIGDAVKRSLANLFRGFRLGFVAFGGAVFALIIGLYTAVNSKEYFSSTIEALPPRHRNKGREVLARSAEVLRGWFTAQLIDMLIIGTLTGIGLWISGVEYWAVFGLLTAVMGIIPYVGIMLVVLAASLITLTSEPDKIIWVLIVFGVTQQLEGNVILPMVMKDKVELPEVPLLLFMFLLGSFFGILGVFIAPPLLAIMRTFYILIYLPFINQETSQ